MINETDIEAFADDMAVADRIVDGTDGTKGQGMESERYGDWMQTATGRQFWPMDPRSSEVHIEDIAHSLSHLCRYAGHCKTFYSVAQHSVLVAESLPRELQFWGLMHDAAEAYVVDIPRPLKRFLTGYAEIEAGVMSVICERFGMSGLMPHQIKRADNAILADEMRCLMLEPAADWKLQEPPIGIDIVAWTPHRAKTAFLQKFHELTGEAQ